MFKMVAQLLLILVLVSSVMMEKPIPSPSLTLDVTHNKTIEHLVESLSKDPTDISSCEQQVAESLCLAASRCLNFLASNVTSLDNLVLDKITFPILCSQFLNTDSLPSLKNEVKSGNHGKPSAGEVWGYGLLCVTIISIMSVAGVGVLPLMSKSFYSEFLTGLIGLAVGSLAGSAVFHLIPSAFNLSKVPFYPHHSYLSISLAVWAGMYLFFIIERFMKIWMDAKARREGEPILPGHGHSHTNGKVGGGAEEELMVQVVRSDTTSSLLAQNSTLLSPQSRGCAQDCRSQGSGRKRCCSETITDQEKLAIELDDHKNSLVKSATELDDHRNSLVYEQSLHAVKASFGHIAKPHPETRPTVESVKKLEEGRSKIATVAWMIIFGDGLHNFIDGLSIGAAFSESLLTGVSVSIAVLCEEFPHELGDFAVLLNAGMSMKQAMCYNFLSACTCYCGFVLGVLLGELDANIYIFGLAGGMFLYISLVDMVPELNEVVETASRDGVGKALRIFFIQNIGILIGIISLFTLAKFQDEIQFDAV